MSEINPVSFEEAAPWRKRFMTATLAGRRALVQEMWRRKVPMCVMCIAAEIDRDAIHRLLNLDGVSA